MNSLRTLLFLLIAIVVLPAHDMFLKMDDYHLPPGIYATIELVNGTFAESENVIDRDRMQDVSLVGNGERTAVPAGRWTEQSLSTLLHLKTGEPGTWVAGVSTKARTIEMEAQAFNDYLAHDGVLDELAWRRENGAADQPANERYSKHVKTIFQVGEERSGDWATELGYPVEFVPLSNPYDLEPGDEIRFRLLADGEPLADQPLIVGHAGSHDHDHDHAHDHAADHDHDDAAGHTHGGPTVRTDAAGETAVTITEPGVWHLRTIRMERLDDPELTHESNWATLTFGVADPNPGHGHSHTAGEHAHDHGDGAHTHGPDTHTHEHEHEGGLPGWAWWAVSVLFVTVLFFYFNRRTDAEA